MRIVEPKVELLWATPDSDRVIERMGRIAYKSEDKTTPESSSEFIRMLIRRGHESVLEHAVAAVIIVTDRGVTHEEVRHRIGSYTQESTRYCNYSNDKFGNEISIIEPPGLNDTQKARRDDLMRHVEQVYMAEIDEGLTPQIARGVLPTCLKTEIGTTFNLRQWRHFFRMRCAPNAHPQMRLIARMCLGVLYRQVSHVIFDDLWIQFGDNPIAGRTDVGDGF